MHWSSSRTSRLTNPIWLTEDMYHLIGALLLEFCVGFYGEFKMLEEEQIAWNSKFKVFRRALSRSLRPVKGLCQRTKADHGNFPAEIFGCTSQVTTFGIEATLSRWFEVTLQRLATCSLPFGFPYMRLWQLMLLELNSCWTDFSWRLCFKSLLARKQHSQRMSWIGLLYICQFPITKPCKCRPSNRVISVWSFSEPCQASTSLTARNAFLTS